MDIQNILSKVDHTLLAPDCTKAQIQELCDDAEKYHVASVCIPLCYVKFASEYLGDRLAVCTVIGFPCGYTTTQAKVFEASQAISNGAKEVDNVVNLTDVEN